MTWTRGPTIGRGTSATVSLAFLDKYRTVAAKSSPLSNSSSLRHEESILHKLRHCPYIVSSFGHDVTTEADGECFYNLFLEYLPRGSLHDIIRQSGGTVAEPTARRYAKSILQAVKFIHDSGYVHCDVKLENVLVCDDGSIKIADFGLAKKAGEEEETECLVRGTPIYMSPESVAEKLYEAPMDIWAIGCAVAEMVSGRPPWRRAGDDDAWALMMRIGFGGEDVEIPTEMSENGRDFLRKCLVRDAEKRWTAEMLLDHPFLVEEEEVAVRSPTSVLSSSLCFSTSVGGFGCAADDRVRMMATGKQKPDWYWYCSLEDGWISVREGEGSDPTDRIGLVATTRRTPDWWQCCSSGEGWICVRGCCIHQQERKLSKLSAEERD